MRKKLFILSVLINFIFLFFFTMCVRYTDKNSYNIQNLKKENREKEVIFKEYPEIKSVDLLYGASILFELYEIKDNLSLEKVELFYKNKNIGKIEINKEIIDLEDFGAKEFYENGRRIFKKEFSIEKDLLEILGENDEKYNIGYLEDGFILIIYLKDLDKEKTFIIKKEFSVSFEKKGYDLFIPSI
ncbi:hypothetical protein [Fusobacterium polymorphum]|uniref:hypothetical protein n=1 Tax=Fusobacterium nucleatum subsp. polymorphum TaxID=76857 RepID=UPI001C6E351E|nr:hypothetical protein [Fusobacterium polymorphum]QYR61646.1 hypothetical protein JY402_02100 [Fusobacterium polymorphum]